MSTTISHVRTVPNRRLLNGVVSTHRSFVWTKSLVCIIQNRPKFWSMMISSPLMGVISDVVGNVPALLRVGPSASSTVCSQRMSL